MKLILFSSLLMLFACGVKHSSMDYGRTTVAQLIAEKGYPIEENKIPLKDSKILVYPENEKYQIENDIVTNGFKDPKNDEKLVLYWKHKFKECETSEKKIAVTDGHTLPEYELKCNALGLTVIYPEGSPYVLRIVEHAKK